MHAWMSRWAGKGRGLTGFVVGVVATLTLVGGGVAIAAIPSTTTAKFNGCVNKDTGVLRVINYQAGKRCKKSEKGISWAQGWTYKGLWRATTSYRPGDVVLDNGSSYVARAASLAKSPPSDASRWGLLASPGPQGATGATGARGSVRRAGRTGRPTLAMRVQLHDAALAVPSGQHVRGHGDRRRQQRASSVLMDCRLLLGGSRSTSRTGSGSAGRSPAVESSAVSLTGARTLTTTGTAELQCQGTSAWATWRSEHRRASRRVAHHGPWTPGSAGCYWRVT